MQKISSIKYAESVGQFICLNTCIKKTVSANGYHV